MRSLRIRRVVLGLTAIALFDVGGRAGAAGVKEAKIKALLRERFVALEKIAATTAAEFQQNGRVSYDKVVESKQAARNAELDLCDTDKERVAVLEKMLKDAKDSEQIMEAMQTQARVPYSTVLKTTVDRLEVEIALERLKAKLAAGPVPPAGGGSESGPAPAAARP